LDAVSISGPAKDCASAEPGIHCDMRFARAAFLLIVSIVLTGCGYVHFGRLPSAPQGDAALATAYSDLTTEHKILKQELALARKEGDALRIALEHTGSAGKLRETQKRPRQRRRSRSENDRGGQR
jgi:hypothetical protein